MDYDINESLMYKLHAKWNHIMFKFIISHYLSDVSMEDSANYSCDVRAPGSQILGHVTHRIFIRGKNVWDQILHVICN
jgi:hypothetical protein